MSGQQVNLIVKMSRPLHGQSDKDRRGSIRSALHKACNHCNYLGFVPAAWCPSNASTINFIVSWQVENFPGSGIAMPLAFTIQGLFAIGAGEAHN